jgi:hypothetical protein
MRKGGYLNPRNDGRRAQERDRAKGIVDERGRDREMQLSEEEGI